MRCSPQEYYNGLKAGGSGRALLIKNILAKFDVDYNKLPTDFVRYLDGRLESVPSLMEISVAQYWDSMTKSGFERSQLIEEFYKQPQPAITPMRDLHAARSADRPAPPLKQATQPEIDKFDLLSNEFKNYISQFVFEVNISDANRKDVRQLWESLDFAPNREPMWKTFQETQLTHSINRVQFN